jgi:hypothetical protein
VKKTDIKEFMRGNDIFRKLEVAIEEIRVGQADAVFQGLQNGKCTVDIVWDGAYIHFYPRVDVKIDPTVQTQEPEHEKVTEPEEPTPEPEEPKAKKHRRDYTA